jgi:hypothetical protein
MSFFTRMTTNPPITDPNYPISLKLTIGEFDQLVNVLNAARAKVSPTLHVLGDLEARGRIDETYYILMLAKNR